MPDSSGHFDKYGGKYVPETLIPALEELEKEYNKNKNEPSFQNELNDLLENFGGRETPLYYASRISQELGFKIFLKRYTYNIST